MPRFIVCPACEGTGRDDSTAYAITAGELDEFVGSDPSDRMEYVRELANLTQPCGCCHGQRVVTPDAGDEWHASYDERAMRDAEMRYGY